MPTPAARRRSRVLFQALESRVLMSGSNAIDRVDFGNLASEAAHRFEPGVPVAALPSRGVGSVGASGGLTYRNPSGDPDLTFTIAVDPARQNYLSVRVWGNDVPSDVMDMTVATTVETLEENGGNVQFPNRFVYYTAAIPIAQTSGKTSIQLTLDAGRPVYSAYTHTATMFAPDSNDPTGSKPAVTGEPTLDPLTASEALGTVASPGILLNKRKSIFDAGGYLDQILARQIMPTTPDAPRETYGLDLWTNVSSWNTGTRTDDNWRDQVGGGKHGPGYSTVPDELLGVLSSVYLLQPFTDQNGSVVGGMDRYRDAGILQRIVLALDGATYLQGSDGGFHPEADDDDAGRDAFNVWQGLTSTPRGAGHAYEGSTARGKTWTISLEGVDTYAMGWAIIRLLNDPVGGPALQAYLNQPIDADLNAATGAGGKEMLRAHAWERMLYDHYDYIYAITGGTTSQHLFNELGMYATHVALGKLQALFPNAAYPTNNNQAFTRMKETMGLIPTTTMRGTDPGTGSGLTNYEFTTKGFGESHGALSTGYDGGGYGSILPWLAVRYVQLAEWDVNADVPTIEAVRQMADATVDSYDQFLSPLERATVNGSGVVTSVTRGWGPEPYITYRDTKNVNNYANVLEFNTQFPAADPNGVLANAYARRSAYLDTQYGQTTTNGAGGGSRSVNYLRDLESYESTIRSLINVNPATLTPLPAEPGQPDFAWADVQAGAVAFMNNGQRFYANLNWRNNEYNGGFANIKHSNIARVHYTTDTIERAGQFIMPKDAANVQADGNLTGLPIKSPKVLRYGDYLIVLNDGTTAYTAKLPPGVGQAKDLATGALHGLGGTVNVAAGQYAIFWLAASGVVSPLGSGADIGAVGTPGSNSYANGVHTVSGAGADIGGAADAFRFVSTNASGDTTLIAQVMGQTGSSAAEAGVMFRADHSPGSPFAALVRSPGNGLRFEYRTAAGAASAWVTVPTPLAPVWVKLTRSGGSVAAYYSTDNATWTQIGSAQPIALPSAALLGLAVSSHNTGATSTATFANVAITPGVAPTVAAPASASAGTVTGTNVNLSVLGADNAGEAALTYTWTVLGDPPAPVTFSTNKTNGAKNTTATFATEGTYTFRVLITDAAGAVTSSDVTVVVQPVATSVAVVPATALLPQGGSTLLYAAVQDQFGQPMENPPAVTWSIDAAGVGTVDQSGVYTAPASGGGAAAVRATAGAVSGVAALTVQAPIGIFTNTAAVGNPTLAGSASHSAGTYTVSAGGNDIWGTSDQFRFVYLPVTGDAVITARVASMGNTHTFAKAGVMFRTSLDANSPYALNYVTPNSGTRFEYRNNAGGSSAGASTGLASGAPPTYIRLTRAGNTISAAYSTDGVNFTTHALSLASITGMTAGSTVYVGLVVCSHNTGSLNTVTFNNVSITQSASPLLYTDSLGTSSGSSTASGAAATLTSTGGDIWGNADSFQFTYVPITGDGSITARVTSITGSSSAKVGVMIRGSLAAGGQHMSALLNPNGNARYAWRTSAGGSTSEAGAGASGVPYWLRVTRAGNALSAYRSVDGVTWVQIGSTRTITMGATAYVGLANASLGSQTVATYDNIAIAGTPNVGPSIATPAAASANPVTTTSATLSVLGADPDAAESNLAYTWELVNLPPADVTFSANGTNAAKNTVATFTKAGTYNFRVTVSDTGGLAVASFVTVIVNQTLTSIAVTPATPAVGPGGTRQFAATALDQFGKPLATQPGSFVWSLPAGGGSISASGLFTAQQSGGSGTVRAASGAINGSTVVTITNQSPLVQTSVGATAAATGATSAALSVPAVDDAGEAALTYTWSVVGTPPSPVTFGGTNGTNAGKNTTATFTAPGTYTFQVAITDAAGQTTTATASVTIDAAMPSVFTGTAGDDRYYVRRSGDQLQVWVGGAGDGGGAPTHSAAFSSVSSLTFDGLGGNDLLTVEQNDAVPAGGIAFNGGAGDDTLVLKSMSGAAAVAFAAGGGGGAQTVTIDGGAYAFGSDLAGATLNVLGGAVVTLDASQRLGGVHVGGAGSILAINPGGGPRVLDVGALPTFSGGGRLDLADGRMIVRNAAGAEADLRQLIRAGRTDDGTWEGLNGIVTTRPAAQNGGLTTLGYASAAEGLGLAPGETVEWHGLTVGGADLIVRYTWAGDANLDGAVDGGDYAYIDAYVGSTGSDVSYLRGDFNLDGFIDGGDYAYIDVNVGAPPNPQ